MLVWKPKSTQRAGSGMRGKGDNSSGAGVETGGGGGRKPSALFQACFRDNTITCMEKSGFLWMSLLTQPLALFLPNATPGSLPARRLEEGCLHRTADRSKPLNPGSSNLGAVSGCGPETRDSECGQVRGFECESPKLMLQLNPWCSNLTLGAAT